MFYVCASYCFLAGTDAVMHMLSQKPYVTGNDSTVTQKKKGYHVTHRKIMGYARTIACTLRMNCCGIVYDFV
jgi:hypothetical protein